MDALTYCLLIAERRLNVALCTGWWLKSTRHHIGKLPDSADMEHQVVARRIRYGNRHVIIPATVGAACNKILNAQVETAKVGRHLGHAAKQTLNCALPPDWLRAIGRSRVQENNLHIAASDYTQPPLDRCALNGRFAQHKNRPGATQEPALAHLCAQRLVNSHRRSPLDVTCNFIHPPGFIWHNKIDKSAGKMVLVDNIEE